MIAIVAVLAAGVTVKAQKRMPDIKLTDIEGVPVNSSALYGKSPVTLVHFWATYCIPCKKLMGAIAGRRDTWKTKYGVDIVAVSIDDERKRANVKTMIKEKGWKYRFFIDSDQQLKRALGFLAIPQTFLVDSKGNILYSHSGYQDGDERIIEAQLKKIAQ